jgi:hypothetical protein
LRIVLVFEQPPEDRSTKADKLSSLVGSFASATDEVRSSVHPLGPGGLRRRLDDALESLRDRAGASVVAVVDTSSPEIWGTSEAHRACLDVVTASELAQLSECLRAEGLDAAELLAEGPAGLDPGLRRIGTVDLFARTQRLREHGESFGMPRGPEQWRRQVLMARGIERVRRADESGTPVSGWLGAPDTVTAYVRTFAGIYRLVAVFDCAYSELKAEGAVARALPHVERLVTSLPPTEPPHGGAKPWQAPR